MPEFVCISVRYFLGEFENLPEVDSIRTSSVIAGLGTQWVEVQPDFASTADPVAAVNRATEQAIAAHPGFTPLVFAPDCTSALGIMKGLESRSPDVLWLDAHGDFNTPQTTPSGFLGGMPLAALVGRGNQDLMAAIGLASISETRVILSDARNLDPLEGEALRASRVTHILDLAGLHNINWEGRPLYLHLDTDLLDPSAMPTLHYPEPNGPSLDALVDVLEHVKRVSTLAGAYISLWDDRLPGAEQAKAATLRLVEALVS